MGDGDDITSPPPGGDRGRGRTADRVLVPLALLLGLAMRGLWLAHHGLTAGLGGEARYAAIGFVNNGFLSDAYHYGGARGEPTAHLLPLPSLAAGEVYRLLGVDSRASLVALSALATAAVLAGFALLYRAFGWLDVSRPARLAALFALCVVPFNPFLETIDFRYWEGGYAVLVAAAVLLGVVRADATRDTRPRTIAALALLAALLFFLSPQLGVAAYACLGVLAWRRLPARAWPGAVLAAAAALALFLVPWTIRNAERMGRPIVLRSNLGLEMALAFHDRALLPDQREQFRQRLVAIHPDNSAAAYARLRAAGGEVAYADGLGRETRAWIAAHPADTVRLGLRHIAQLVFPPAWFWSVYTEVSGVGTRIKVAAFWAIGLLGLAGAVGMAARRGGRHLYPAVMLLVPILPYALVQPILRYHYVIFALGLFCAAWLVDAAVRRPREVR